MVQPDGARIDTGGTPVTVNGVVAWEVEIRRKLRLGRSGGDTGVTSADVVGYEGGGSLTVDNFETAVTLDATPTQSDLELKGKKAGGTNGTIAIDKVEFSNVGSIPMDAAPQTGNTERFPVGFSMIFDAADDGIEDFITTA